MPLPNFILFGAPKAGTTALHRALTQHPDVFMSRHKEPAFFGSTAKEVETVADDPTGGMFSQGRVSDPKDYLALFDAVAGERAIGEASVTYIRSFIACQRIRNLLPDVKLVAVLRQPADRAYSNYWYLVQGGVEPCPSFEAALADEPHRIESGWSSMTYHRDYGFYGRMLEPYYDAFPRERIKVFLYDDWKANPQGVLHDLFEFLEVDADFAPKIERYNRTLIPHHRRFDAWAKTMHPNLPGARRVPRVLRRPTWGVVRRLNERYNLMLAPKINPDTRARLTEEYRPDILKLQDLIGRDLSDWLK